MGVIDDIDDVINYYVKKGKSFKAVINALNINFKREISEVIDSIYIEDKYIELVIEQWLAEVPRLITKLLDPHQIPDLFRDLNSINTFNECFKLIGKQSVYSPLIKDLIKSSSHVKSQEKQIICKFKKLSFNYILNETSSIKNELEFLQCLERLIRVSKDIEKLCNKLQITSFLNDGFKFKDLLVNIKNCNITGEEIIKVKNAGTYIIQQENFYFISYLEELLRSYLEPVIVSETSVDGRAVLQVSGKHIVISKLLTEIRKKLLQHSYIEEIRFINASVIHVDSDFSVSVWHGKNIVVYSGILIVSNDMRITWDVSGKDAETVSDEAAGTAADGTALSGADGKPGESGGNVLIMVESIENGQNLRIISNGGKGSKGQDGGKGADGEDGNCVDGKSFKKMFPAVSKFINSEKIYNLNTTFKNIMDNLQSVEICHFGSVEVDINYIRDQLNTNILRDIYLKVKTKDDCEITFSFFVEGFFYFCQSYLLFKGSPGKAGHFGADGGSGGKGGFAGDIDIQVFPNQLSAVNRFASNGENGVAGKMGISGIPGRNGSDKAYMDSSNTITGNWPNYVLPAENDDVRLAVRFCSEKKSETVFCPYNKMYVNISREERIVKDTVLVKNYSQNNALHLYQQQEVQARRKKTISKESICEQYKQRTCELDYHSLQDSLQKTSAAIEEKNISYTTLQTEQVNATIKRQVCYLSHNLQSSAVPEIDFIIDNSVRKISAINKMDFFNSNGVFDLKRFTQVRLNLEQLQGVWETQNLDTVSTYSGDDNMFKVLFLKKYQLAVLEQLEIKCLNHPEQIFSKGISAINVRFNDLMNNELNNVLTVITKENPSEVEQYFLNDSIDIREKAINICNSIHMDEICLRKPIDVFMYEFGCSSYQNKTVIEIFDQLQLFKEENNEKQKNKLLPLKNVLLKNENKEISKTLIESIQKKNNVLFISFEDKIQNDTFLSHIYSLYIKESKKHCDWKTILERNYHKPTKYFPFPMRDYFCPKKPSETQIIEKEIRNTFYDCIRVNGPRAACYREFLALHFEINILVYSKNENNIIDLIHNHNPTVRNSVHFLFTGGSFELLSFDSNLAKMIEEHKARIRVYNKILLHIGSFTEIEQLDLFLNSTFSSSDYECVQKSKGITQKITYTLAQDNNVKGIMNSFKSEEDRSLLSSRLEKLKLEFIGYERILYYMDLHFNTEGNHMTAKELCFVINFVLKLAVSAQYTLQLVSWIIAAYSQTLWLVELTLLRLELYLKQTLKDEKKTQWRKYLSDDNEKERLMLFIEKLEDENCRVNIQCVDEVLELMSNIPSAHVGLGQLDLDEWKYYLKDRYWAYQLKTSTDWTEEQLKEASFYLVTLENLHGNELCKNLVYVINKRRSKIGSDHEIEIVLNVLKRLKNKEININNLLEKLSQSSVIDWVNLVERSSSFIEERPVTQLMELIRGCGNTSKSILSKLNEISSFIKDVNSLINILMESFNVKTLPNWIFKLLQFFHGHESSRFDKFQSFMYSFISDDKQFEHLFNKIRVCLVKTNSNKTEEVNNKISKDHFEFKNLLNVFEKNKNEILLATVVKAIEIKYNKKLRNAQKLAVVTLLKSGKNILGQVSTGEGKSLIVVSVAIMKALTGEKVDVITSSHVLAERDACAYKDIYKMFRINVGHNCSENIEERKGAYSNCQVVYGELANFQRDYLLDRVYDQNILGDRDFQSVIVDEVDSMLLDKGNNMLYLSHDIPGLDKLEPLFVYIWGQLNRPVTHQDDAVINIAGIKENILYEMFGTIKKEHLRYLDTELDEMHVNTTWELLVKEKMISGSGQILKEDYHELNKLTTNCIHKDHLMYLFKKVIARQKQFEIPNYLKSFVETHLEEWIQSAMKAMSMKNGIDYVVDVDRSGTSCDRHPNITIIDHDTGTDLVNSQWEEGLHQFLQLKHGCKLSLISLKAVFKSNVSYLQLYSKLYGLTGTLGSERERELLKETYAVDFVTIPTAKTKQFKEEIPVVCSSFDEWENEIFQEVYEVTEKRSALVICETVHEVLSLKRKFECLIGKTSNNRHIHTYTRDYEDLNVAKELKPGHIIISTNLAGRGTDITLSDELVEAGGLHVCLSFLPSNSRIEEQAYGRAARNGQPGSAKLIFRNNSLNSTSKIIDLKKQRDTNEIFRIKDINTYYRTRIHPEEELFNDFKCIFNELKKSKHQKEVKSILLQNYLDQWAFWLDENSKSISSISIEDFLEKIQFCTENFNLLIEQIKNPSHLIKLALVYIKNENYKKAISLFNKVIKEEPLFCEVAIYYRLYAKAMEKDLKTSDLLSDLETVAKQFKQRMQSSLTSAHVIDWIKDRNPKSLLQIDSFKEQQLNVSKIYNVYLQSIYDMLGHEIGPESFFIPPDIDEEFSSRLYNYLVKNKVITSLQLKSNLSEKDLVFIQKYYGIFPEELKVFLHKYMKIEFDEETILKDLKDSYNLPSREFFWETLIDSDILVNERKYILVDFEKLTRLDPSLLKVIQPLAVKAVSTNSIWLYHPKEVGNECHTVLKKNIFKRKVGKDKYKLLKKKGIIVKNKQAIYSEAFNKNVRLYEFDSLTKSDFKKVGISEYTSSRIIDELKRKNILKEVKNGKKYEYSLLINAENISNIELTIHKAYSDDVKSLLSFCFAFRVGLEKTRYLMEHHIGNLEDISLPLPIKLHKQIIRELKEREIITGSYLNHEVDYVKVLPTLFRVSMEKEGYEELFNELYNENIGSKIINDLIEKGWLVKSSANHLTKTYDISYDEKLKKLKKPRELAPEFCSQTETIEFILSQHFKRSKIYSVNQTSMKYNLDGRKGTLNTIQTRSFSLMPLLPVLEDNKMLTSECDVFSLNQFDKVLVLGEKKWTFQMKIDTSLATIYGITEIAVGVALCLVVNRTAGQLWIEDGIGDLVYAKNNLSTCHFYWKNYLFNKITSLTVSSLYLAPNVFKSSFAINIYGVSFQSIKQECSLAIEKVSNNIKSLFAKSNSVNKGVLCKLVVKRIATTTAQRVALGVGSAVLDHVIEPQMFKLADVVLETIHSGIDSTIHNHPVTESVKSLYHICGEQKSRDLIRYCFLFTIREYGAVNKNKWTGVTGVLTTVITQLFNSSSESKLDSNIELCKNMFVFSTNVIEIIRAGQKYFIHINRWVADILNNLECELQRLLNQESVFGLNSIVWENALTNFISDILSDWKSEMKDLLSEHIKDDIIHPVMQITSNLILTYSSKMVSKRCNSFFTEEEIWELNKFKKCSVKESCSTVKSVRKEFLHTEYDECLLELFKKRRNVFVHILKENTLIDIDCIELFCKILPMTLEKEGIFVPCIKIIVKKNNTEQIFCTAKSISNTPTITLSLDAGCVTNLKRNRFHAKDVFEFTYKSVLQSNPQLKDRGAEYFHMLVVSVVEKSDDIQQFIYSFKNEEALKSNIVQADIDDPPMNNAGKAESVEPPMNITRQARNDKRLMNASFKPSRNSNYQIKNQESHSQSKSENLSYAREKKKLSSLTPSEDHIFRGFKNALEKINNHLHKNQNHLKPPFELELVDFNEIKHDIVPAKEKSSGNPFYCYTLHYELVMPFTMPNSDRLIEFGITMYFKNTVRKPQPHRPQGPHIVYEIRPVNDVRHIDKGTKGHVMLSLEYEHSCYTLEDCRSVGEVMVHTPGYRLPHFENSLNLEKQPDLRTKYKVLIIEDSMLKFLAQHMSGFNCVTRSFPHISPLVLKSKIADLSINHTGFHCVVLYVGTSSVRSRTNEQTVARDIIKVIKEIQLHMDNVKVILCTLVVRKYHASKDNERIHNINYFIKMLGSKINLDIFEPIGFIGNYDLKRNGVHLNKGGFSKFGLHLSETILKCLEK